MNIAFVGHVGNSILVRGGLEVLLNALADGLSRRGHSVTRTVGGITRDPDLVQFVGAFYGLGDAFRQASGCPRVVMPVLLHDDNALKEWHLTLNTWRGRLPGSLMSHRRMMIQHADLVIANSQNEAAEARRWGAENVRVVHAGVDMDRFRPIRFYSHALDDQWRLRVDAFAATPSPLVVSVGRLERRKHHLAVAQACETVGARLLVAGRRSPTESLWLDELVDQAGPNLTVWEDAPDAAIAEALAVADVHVLASRHETTGLVSLEAAACGARPVTVDQPTAREYFGSFGVFSESESSADLATAIRSALSRGRLTADERGAVEAYDWNRICERIEAEYRSLLERL